MTAKITLIGQPQSLCVEKDIVTFKIIAGPASSTAPKGLPLFKATTYVVQCSQRQYNRGRASEGDKSELVIEGYQEPRIGEDGKPYIAVVALSVASKNQQAARKLEQLREEVSKAEDAYKDNAYVCQLCGQPMMVRAGMIVRPYFAHYKTYPYYTLFASSESSELVQIHV